MKYNKQTIGTRLYLVEETVSTNTELLTHADRYEHGAVLCARRQTAGRGRHQRNWRSQDGGLYFSVLFKNQKDISSIYPFILLSALAVVRNIQSCATQGVAIKWPNDVYINHRKVCGILAESSTIGDSTNIVIGIGVNVNNSISNVSNLRHPAVSLKECRGEEVDLMPLLDRLIDELDKLYIDHLAGKFSVHLPELSRLLYAKGQEVEINSAGKTRTIIPLSFTEEAKLLCLENGKETLLFLGEM
ncbi:MAG: biotin--[acetyl-CoA-carboxylase] ligase [Candidatus Marinimicrobia bacterium]|nr:biotin--[acetyl-CoA-carboxylase] ligase [Candidatus Neomarinimicrobiota bacterium]